MINTKIKNHHFVSHITLRHRISICFVVMCFSFHQQKLEINIYIHPSRQYPSGYVLRLFFENILKTPQKKKCPNAAHTHESQTCTNTKHLYKHKQIPILIENFKWSHWHILYKTSWHAQPPSLPPPKPPLQLNTNKKQLCSHGHLVYRFEVVSWKPQKIAQPQIRSSHFHRVLQMLTCIIIVLATHRAIA